MDYDPDPFMESFDDERVCVDCLYDSGLRKAFNRSLNVETSACDFCGQQNRLTIPAVKIQNLIYSRCLSGKNEAANELTYITAGGGYQGRTYEATELLELAMHAVGDKFYEAMTRKLNVHSLFCDWNHNALCPAEQWKYGWSDFVKTIKHHCRFFFSEVGDDNRERDPYEISPNLFLKHHIPKGIERLGAIRVLRAGTEMYRCRITDSDVEVSELVHIGPPPASDTVGSNRFSPPGISMFYTAATPQVSAAEVCRNSPVPSGQILHTGTFRTISDLRILDFVELSYPEGQFDQDWMDDYHIADFFRDFIEDLRAPINDQSRKHLDYVPTQVLCEYFKFYGVTSNGRHHKIDGIKYSSSIGGEPCY